VLTWFTHQAKGKSVLKLWDFLIASKPSMIIFLCSAILLKEWEESGFSSDCMMECIQKLKGLKFKEEDLDEYFKYALKLEGEYCKKQERVNSFNGLLLEK
jgi:hypothetical protein